MSSDERDFGPALGRRASALVRASRELGDPTQADRARVRSRLHLRLHSVLATPRSSDRADASLKAGASRPAADGGKPGGSRSVARLLSQARLWGSLLAALLAGGAAGVVWQRYSIRSQRHDSLPSQHWVSAPASPRAANTDAVLDQPGSASTAVPPKIEPSMLATTPGRSKLRAHAPRVRTRTKPETRPTLDPQDIATPTPTAVASKESSSQPSSAPAASVVRDSSLAAELALLGAAQRALANGELERALSELDRHAARYPNGSLVQERKAARAVTLCRLGRQDDGLVELRRMEVDAADSPLLSWARKHCRADADR
jgi:hypothetical protein